MNIKKLKAIFMKNYQILRYKREKKLIKNNENK